MNCCKSCGEVLPNSHLYYNYSKFESEEGYFCEDCYLEMRED